MVLFLGSMFIFPDISYHTVFTTGKTVHAERADEESEKYMLPWS
jgi:hypothetical protein